MNKVNYDITKSFDSLKQKMPYLFNEIQYPIVGDIIVGDGMFDPNQQEYYALCGLSALENIMQALKINKRNINDIHNILDFACGYGRVARVINSAFPKASLLVCDADQKAVNAVSSILPVEGIKGSIDLDNFSLGKQFDLIWIGSLFTHIKSGYASIVLDFLVRHLSPNGMVVFSIHGSYVAERIRKREKTYSLEESQIEKFIEDYNISGYGFSPYSGETEYGISVTKLSYISKLLESYSDIRQIMYIERGWVSHQDVIAFTKVTT